MRRPFQLHVGLVAVAVLLLSACSGSDGAEGDLLPAEADVVVAASAEAMGAVSSVRFELEPTGASVYIDPLKSLGLKKAIGRFAAPNSAEAILTITVQGLLTTELGAVSIDDEAWLSNPITGNFETLPESYNIDPSRFFDPKGAWQPMLEGLTDVEFVESSSDLYHLRAIAAAEDIEAITAGLVRGADIPLDLWIDPVTAHVNRLEFSAENGDDQTDWVLELSEFNEPISIEPPELG